MVFIPGGTFRMGSDKHYAEEAPVSSRDRRCLLDRSEHRSQIATSASLSTRPAISLLPEIPPDPKDYPGALPHMLKAGSLVFKPPNHTGQIPGLEHNGGHSNSVPTGADLMDRAARLLGSTIIRLYMSPNADAEAYAKWADKELADRG